MCEVDSDIKLEQVRRLTRNVCKIHSTVATIHKILSRSNQRRWDGTNMQHAWGLRNMYRIWLGGLNGSDQREDNIKTDLRETIRGYRFDSSGSGQEPVADSCEHGN
jgi:hypothetical protein